MSEERFSLSRRKALAALGTIGVASAGAGLGTSAYFSDRETFENNQLTAGELDLKLDWEEHYSDWSADESEGVDDVVMTDGDAAAVPDGYIGLPDPAAPLIAVPDGDLGAFMSNTAVEAFPDTVGDGNRTPPEGYEACTDGADAPDDLDPTMSLRTENADTYDEEMGTKPLIDLGDVKPGDFGELTLGFELCDNPGYVWLTGRNVSASENGLTEPERDDEDEGEGVELLDEIRTVWWYDDGDNVLRAPCDRASETIYLIENVGSANAGDGATPAGDDGPYLFEVELAGGVASLTDLTALPDRIEAGHVAATPDGSAVYVIDRDTGALAKYDVSSGGFSDPGAVSGGPYDGGEGSVVLTAFSPDGTLYIADNDTDALYTVDDLDSSPTATAVGDTGIDVSGADIAFTSDGTLYLYSNAVGSGTLFTVDTDTGDATAVGETGVNLTGLAVRDAGAGDLIGSATDPADELIVIDRDDGSILDRYPIERNGDAYAYDYGDMTVGALCEQVFRRGTLGEDLAALSSGQGIPLDGDLRTDFDEIGGADDADPRECFSPGGTHHVGFAWYLPVDHGNEVQGDSVTFDLGFYTEQCRHNDGSGMNSEETDGDEGGR